ncbi:hypothetical protein [Shouchella patagoniensis]|uniref:hypothetical protein n=1 Tax=Shouchella patagoniensis TaxID=228576 RepID=UPI000995B55E|nr:hypothetical protein [Shouchella patagoniensis]
MKSNRNQLLPTGAFVLFLIAIATKSNIIFIVALFPMVIAVFFHVKELFKQGKVILATPAILSFILAMSISYSLFFDL